MSNIVTTHQPRQEVIPAHQVAFDLVPRAVIEDLFNAAISVGWAADNECYSARSQEARDLLGALQKAVCAASQYTTPVSIEVNRPA